MAQIDPLKLALILILSAANLAAWTLVILVVTPALSQLQGVHPQALARKHFRSFPQAPRECSSNLHVRHLANGLAGGV
jgi:hypothetical protein